MNEHTQVVEKPQQGMLGIVISADQVALIKNTIAKGATDDELRLFFYDCQRRGVHPLDRLIHFTVRTGQDNVRKYTPIVGIDFMRIRAAETGEFVGCDPASFDGAPKMPDFVATVTVYRLVQGMRCAFSGTARWPEFYPGDRLGMIWNKMPHNQLAKCAEAAALRKGFPAQLAEIYTTDEMAQAEAPPAELPLKEAKAKAGTDQTTTQTTTTTTGEITGQTKSGGPSATPPPSVAVLEVDPQASKQASDELSKEIRAARDRKDEAALAALGVRIIRLSEFLTNGDLQAIRELHTASLAALSKAKKQ